MTGYIHELEEIVAKNQNLQNGKAEDAQDRIDNLREFISIAIEYENSDLNNEEEKNLENFLATISLSSDVADEEEEGLSKVSMMTMHSSKGLEFPVVFIVGMEENIFPIARAISSMSDSDIEEERRLCYVGITRAMRDLYLTHVATRTLYGKTSVNMKSRFLGELPEETTQILDSPVKVNKYDHADYSLLHNYAQKYKNQMNIDNIKKVTRSARLGELDSQAGGQEDSGQARDMSNIGGEGKGYDSYDSDTIPKIKIGSLVEHPKFGEGSIISKAGADVTIAFKIKGVKKINLEYTNIKVLKY